MDSLANGRAIVPVRLHWLLLCAGVACLIGALVVGQRSMVSLTFVAESTSTGPLQVFHANNTPFSELQAHVWPLQAGESARVAIDMPASDVRKLRLDPAPGMTQVSICDLKIGVSIGRGITIPPSQIRPASETDIRGDGRCAVITATPAATDPQALIDLSRLGTVLESQEDRSRSAALLWFALGTSCFAVFTVLYYRGRLKQETATRVSSLYAMLPWFYLQIALFFGVTLALVTPPGGVPDEPAHMAKVVLVENGRWLGMEGVATTNPAISGLYGSFQDFLNPGTRFSVSDIVEHAAQPMNCQPSSEAIPSSAASYSPSLYVPSAVALNIACATNSTKGAFIYGSRLGNLLVAVFLTFLGLRFAGGMQWPLFAVAVFPMTLFQQASITADSLTLGLSFCLMGIQAGLATGKVRPALGAEVVVLLLGLALAFAKPGYAWICVGFLFSGPIYRLASRAFAVRALVLVMLPWLVHVGWVLATAQEATPLKGVDPGANLAAVLHHPVEFLYLVVRTLFGPGSEFLWSSAVGLLGWLDVAMPPYAYSLAAVMVFVSLGMCTERGAPRPWMRAGAAVVVLGAALLPIIPMYLYWTPQGAILIEGLQGRYFIPAIAFLFLWLGFAAPVPFRAGGAVFMLAAAVAINASAVARVVIRYFA